MIKANDVARGIDEPSFAPKPWLVAWLLAELQSFSL
jgi:hypothetical protein